MAATASGGSVARAPRPVKSQTLAVCTIALSVMLGLSSGCAGVHQAPAEPQQRPGAPASAAGVAQHERSASPQSAIPVGLEQLNIRVNQDTAGADQNETTIVVNPANAMNIVGGARHQVGTIGRCAYYASFDGGQSWTGGLMVEEQYQRQSDPVVTACPNGSIAYVLISFVPGSAIFVYGSDDGGMTWPMKRALADDPTGVVFYDKPWITCDTTSSPYANRIYTEWMEFEQLGVQTIKLAWSSDGGDSWSSPAIVSDEPAAQNQGVVSVGGDGAVNLVWARRTSETGGVHLFDRSTDGGTTWSTDVVTTDFVDIPADPNFIRGAYPTMDTDRSGGSTPGNIYIAWSDNRNGDPDILLVRSTDGGLNWSAPIRVNDDPLGNGADQFHPWLTVDPAGRVIVVFWDRRRYIDDARYEIWGAISRDGGVTFDRNFVISDVPSDSRLVTFLGDYSAVAASDEWIYPLWADLRSGAVGDADVYTDRYPNFFTYDEVKDVQWTGEDQLSFLEQDARFGVDLSYDVVSGLLGELRSAGNYSNATCLAPAWGQSPFVDSRVPPENDGYYYLVRVKRGRAVGSFGKGSPAARVSVRDPLDDATTGPCP